MLIKDIKFRRIRKLAKKRIKQYKARCYDGEKSICGHLWDDRLSSAFDWDETPEDYDFWCFINKGNYEEAFKLRPSLFKPTKKEFKEAYKMHEQYRLMLRYPG